MATLQSYFNNITEYSKTITSSNVQIVIANIGDDFWTEFASYGESYVMQLNWTVAKAQGLTTTVSFDLTSLASGGCVDITNHRLVFNFVVEADYNDQNFTFTSQISSSSTWPGHTGETIQLMKRVGIITQVYSVTVAVPTEPYVRIDSATISDISMTLNLSTNISAATTINVAMYEGSVLVDSQNVAVDATAHTATFTTSKLWPATSYNIVFTCESQIFSDTRTTSSKRSFQPTMGSVSQSTAQINISEEFLNIFSILVDITTDGSAFGSYATNAITGLLFDTSYSANVILQHPTSTGHETDAYASAILTFTTLDFPQISISSAPGCDRADLTAVISGSYTGTYTYQWKLDLTEQAAATLSGSTVSTSFELLDPVTVYNPSIVISATHGEFTKTKIYYGSSFTTLNYSCQLNITPTSQYVTVQVTNCPYSWNYEVAFELESEISEKIALNKLSYSSSYAFTTRLSTNTTHSITVYLYKAGESTPLYFTSQSFTTNLPAISGLVINYLHQEGGTATVNCGIAKETFDVRFWALRNGTKVYSDWVAIPATSVSASAAIDGLCIDTTYTLGVDVRDTGSSAIVKTESGDSFTTAGFVNIFSCTATQFSTTVTANTAAAMLTHGDYFVKINIKDSDSAVIDSSSWISEPFAASLFTSTALDPETTYSVEILITYGEASTSAAKQSTFVQSITTAAFTCDIVNVNSQQTIAFMATDIERGDYTVRFYCDSVEFASETITNSVSTLVHRCSTLFTTYSSHTCEVRVTTSHNKTYTVTEQSTTLKNQVDVSFDPTYLGFTVDVDSPNYTYDTFKIDVSFNNVAATAKTDWIIDTINPTWTTPEEFEVQENYTATVSIYDWINSTRTLVSTRTYAISTLSLAVAVTDYVEGLAFHLTFTTTPTINTLTYDYTITGPDSETYSGNLPITTSLIQTVTHAMAQYSYTYTIKSSTKTYRTDSGTFSTAHLTADLIGCTQNTWHMLEFYTKNIDSTLYKVKYDLYSTGATPIRTSGETPIEITTRWQATGLPKAATYRIQATVYNYAGTSVIDTVSGYYSTLGLSGYADYAQSFSNHIKFNMHTSRDYGQPITVRVTATPNTGAAVVQTFAYTGTSQQIDVTGLTAAMTYTLMIEFFETDTSIDSYTAVDYLYSKTVRFGTLTVLNNTVAAFKFGIQNFTAGEANLFVAKVYDNGTLVWTQSDAIAATETGHDFTVSGLDYYHQYSLEINCYNGSTLIDSLTKVQYTAYVPATIKVASAGVQTIVVYVDDLPSTFPVGTHSGTEYSGGLVDFYYTERDGVTHTYGPFEVLEDSTGRKYTANCSLVDLRLSQTYQIYARIYVDTTSNLKGVVKVQSGTKAYGTWGSMTVGGQWATAKVTNLNVAVAVGETSSHHLRAYYKKHSDSTYTELSQTFLINSETINISFVGLEALTTYDFKVDIESALNIVLQTFTDTRTTVNLSGEIVLKKATQHTLTVYVKNLTFTSATCDFELYNGDTLLESISGVAIDSVAYSSAEVEFGSTTSLSRETTYTVYARFANGIILSKEVSTSPANRGTLKITTTASEFKFNIVDLDSDAEGSATINIYNGSTLIATHDVNILHGTSDIWRTTELESNVYYSVEAICNITFGELGTLNYTLYNSGQRIVRLYALSATYAAGGQLSVTLGNCLNEDYDATAVFVVKDANDNVIFNRTSVIPSGLNRFETIFTGINQVYSMLYLTVTITCGEDSYLRTANIRCVEEDEDNLLGLGVTNNEDYTQSQVRNSQIGYWVEGLDDTKKYAISYSVFCDGEAITLSGEAALNNQISVDCELSTPMTYIDMEDGLVPDSDCTISARISVYTNGEYTYLTTLQASIHVGGKPFACEEVDSQNYYISGYVYNIPQNDTNYEIIVTAYDSLALTNIIASDSFTVSSSRRRFSFTSNAAYATWYVRIQARVANTTNWLADYVEIFTSRIDDESEDMAIRIAQYGISVHGFSDITLASVPIGSTVRLMVNGTTGALLDEPIVIENTTTTNVYILCNSATDTMYTVSIVVTCDGYNDWTTNETYFWEDPQSLVTEEPWHWDRTNNGEASAAQVVAAYTALTNHGLFSDFSYCVWNDLVTKIGNVREQMLLTRWDTKYGAESVTKMTRNDRTLTARRMNAMFQNLYSIKDDLTSSSYKILHVEPGDIVLGSYFTTATGRLNEIISMWS